MKQFNKFSLAYAFQVFGVILLFAYPGCSSNNKNQSNEPGQKEVIEKNQIAVRTGFNNAIQAPATIFSRELPGAVMQTDLFSYISFSK